MKVGFGGIDNFGVLIISGFPGSGKSYFTKNMIKKFPNLKDKVIDLDSSKYHKNFPGDYAAAIYNKAKDLCVNNSSYPYADSSFGLKGLSGIILISTHKEVLEALNKKSLQYVTVVPIEKGVTLTRLEERGDSQEFIDMINRNFDDYTSDLFMADSALSIISDDTITQLWKDGTFNAWSKNNS